MPAGKPLWQSRAPVEAAVARIVEQQRVGEYLQIEVRRRVQRRTKRAYGTRPATVVTTTHFSVQSVVDAAAVATAIQQMGWRVYATNQAATELTLTQAVWAYREQYLIEQCFGRLKGASLSLTPFYLQHEHRAVGLILLLSIALRVLVLTQFVAREKLKEQGRTLSGIFYYY